MISFVLQKGVSRYTVKTTGKRWKAVKKEAVRLGGDSGDVGEKRWGPEIRLCQ